MKVLSENEYGVTAYIQKKRMEFFYSRRYLCLNSDEFSIAYNQHEVEQTNWNSEWEKNFTPIQVMI